MDKDNLKQAILNFVKGGDDRDIVLLEKVLHPEFRVVSNNFMGKPGAAIIDRATYISNVEKGIFGGLPRIVNIESTDINGTIATVKIRLKSAENNFVSYNSFVLDTDNEWKLIHNLAVVEAIQ